MCYVIDGSAQASVPFDLYVIEKPFSLYEFTYYITDTEKNFVLSPQVKEDPPILPDRWEYVFKPDSMSVYYGLFKFLQDRFPQEVII